MRVQLLGLWEDLRVVATCRVMVGDSRDVWVIVDRIAIDRSRLSAFLRSLLLAMLGL